MGIDFAEVIVGPADTVEYLQFWAKADQFLTPLGHRMFSPNSPGDHIVVDNCPTHRYEEAEALALTELQNFLHRQDRG